ncbi:hypothetical protein SUGI_1127170 [Cryptomeria japonica]|nr:hypothetical protein SUGI_1127170 [Cryptomeria japonica]
MGVLYWLFVVQWSRVWLRWLFFLPVREAIVWPTVLVAQDPGFCKGLVVDGFPVDGFGLIYFLTAMGSFLAMLWVPALETCFFRATMPCREGFLYPLLSVAVLDFFTPLAASLSIFFWLL